MFQNQNILRKTKRFQWKLQIIFFLSIYNEKQQQQEYCCVFLFYFILFNRYVKENLHFIMQYLFDGIFNVPFAFE